MVDFLSQKQVRAATQATAMRPRGAQVIALSSSKLNAVLPLALQAAPVVVVLVIIVLLIGQGSGVM